MKEKPAESKQSQNMLQEALMNYQESLGMDRDEFSGYLGLPESTVESMMDGSIGIPRWMMLLLDCLGFYE